MKKRLSIFILVPSFAIAQELRLDEVAREMMAREKKLQRLNASVHALGSSGGLATIKTDPGSEPITPEFKSMDVDREFRLQWSTTAFRQEDVKAYKPGYGVVAQVYSGQRFVDFAIRPPKESQSTLTAVIARKPNLHYTPMSFGYMHLDQWWSEYVRSSTLKSSATEKSDRFGDLLVLNLADTENRVATVKLARKHGLLPVHVRVESFLGEHLSSWWQIETLELSKIEGVVVPKKGRFTSQNGVSPLPKIEQSDIVVTLKDIKVNEKADDVNWRLPPGLKLLDFESNPKKAFRVDDDGIPRPTHWDSGAPHYEAAQAQKRLFTNIGYGAVVLTTCTLGVWWVKRFRGSKQSPS